MIGQSKDREVPLPDKKIGDNSLIFKVKLYLFQSLQKNKDLFVLLVSENKQKILNDDFNEIGACRTAIKTSRNVVRDGLVIDEAFVFEDNLFRLKNVEKRFRTTFKDINFI